MQGFSEPDAGSDLANVQTTAVRDGDEWVINGQKVWNSLWQFADYAVLVVKTDMEARRNRNLRYFIVDFKSPGYEARPLRQMTGGSEFCEMFFDNVRVPHENLLGELNMGRHILKKTALLSTAALCAEMVGGGDWVMEKTVNYAKERIAFGVPIGSFQALKHKMVDMYTALEYARSLMEGAAEAIKEDSNDASKIVSMAKSYCGDIYKMGTNEGIQIHGVIGFTWDHDMHLYFKRARSTDTTFGDSTYHRELVAQSLDAQYLA